MTQSRADRPDDAGARGVSALGAQAAVFRLSRREPTELMWIEGLICAALIVAAWWFAIDDAPWITLGAVAFFAVQFVRHGLAGAGAEADRSARLTIDAEGVTIPDIFAARVPWDAIEQISVAGHERREWLSMRVDDLSRYGYTARGVSRLASAFGRSCAAFDIERLEGSAESVRIAIRRFAPARLRETL